MRVTVLVENTSACPNRIGAQHGLSLLIERSGGSLLFDMGSDDLFRENAQALNKDLSEVSVAVLSHGHWDHGGGVQDFFALNAEAPLYVRESAFGPYYSLRDDGEHHWAGLPEELRDHPRIRYTAGDVDLGDGMTLFGDVPDHHGLPIGNQTLFEKIDGQYTVDTFTHEQYLAIVEDETLLLITGCSHRGISNIVAECQRRYKRFPDVVIGGFHLMDYTEEDHKALDDIAHYLIETGATYYTCHCTGDASYAYLKEAMGEQLYWCSGGQEYTF